MSLSIPFPDRKALQKNSILWLLLFVFLITFLAFKPIYFNTEDLYFWIGLMALPVSFQIRKGERSSRYLWVAVGVGLLALLFPTTIGVYCLLVFSMLYILEQLAGKTTFIFASHLLLLSPLFQYFNSLISFPVRLVLSETAGKMLQLAGFDIQVSGNLIRLDGVDFLVDSACSGLFMLRYSFLFAILILAYFQVEGKRWKLKEILPLLAVLFVLNIVGNLVRITLLIVFRIMPEFWFHEILGLLIFLLYSLLPFYFIVRWWAGKKQTITHKRRNLKPISQLKLSFTISVLLLVLAVAGWKNGNRLEKEVTLNGNTGLIYQAEKINDSVYKISTANALIYIKPPVEAYHADHNPLICWKGSGYEFKHIHTTTLRDLEVSVAELSKDADRLYTMWWFDSGHQQTGSQWTWRWRSLSQKEDYYLINITARDMETLRTEALALLEKGIVSK